MKKVKLYNDFLFDFLLESINDGELPFKLSTRLTELLKKIDHKISTKLLIDNSTTKSSKSTLVDYDDKKEDFFTFATSPKLLDYITSKTLTDNHATNVNYFLRNTENDYEIWDENRTSIKIGKFINKIYPDIYLPNGKPGEDLESFVELIKAERTKEMGDFKIVEGEDIVKYYSENSYEDNSYGSTLAGSCMKHNSCQPYIGFYAKNNVKLVVLMSNEKDDKIIGRALLWDISEIDGEKVNRKFLDRIYVIKIKDVAKFKELARKNDWLYKSLQDMWYNTEIIDPKNNSSVEREIKIENIKEYKAYPYMDTLKFFKSSTGILSNTDEDYNMKLESTEGGYFTNNGTEFMYDKGSDTLISEDNSVWSEEQSQYIPADDAVHSESMEDWVSSSYADYNWTYS